MRTFSGTAVVALLVAGVAFAADEASPFEQAPVAPSDAAVSGKLEIVDCGGVPHYAFAGEAEDYFPGEGLETEADLYEEAVLDAKTRFYGLLSGGDPSRRVALSGLFVARHWADGPMRRVVCMVPVSSVRVTGGSPAAQPPPQAAPPEKEALEIGNTNRAISTATPTPTTP